MRYPGRDAFRPMMGGGSGKRASPPAINIRERAGLSSEKDFTLSILRRAVLYQMGLGAAQAGREIFVAQRAIGFSRAA